MVKLPRRRRLSRPVWRGRGYRAEVEIVYAGGSLPSHAYESLTGALHAGIGTEISDLSFTVSSHPYNRVTVAATVQAAKPLAVLMQLDGVLDDALMATGLFEEFDVTGKMLHVAPLDHVWRE